jgi:predicted metal-binding membrane protein
MQDRSVGKRAGLAFAAIPIGFVLLLVGELLFVPGLVFVYELFWRSASIGVTVYLTYRWSGRVIASVVAAALVAWGIWMMVPREFL